MNKLGTCTLLSLSLLTLAGCTPPLPVGWTMMVDPALSQKEGRKCRVANVLNNEAICPEHVVMVKEPELYCQDTLGGVECYASDPRENPLEARNAISPLVAHQVEIADPAIPEPRDVANGRASADRIPVANHRYPPRAIGLGIPVMNQPRQ